MKTREDIFERFADSHKREDLELLVEAMLGKPCPALYYDTPCTAWDVANFIYENDALYEDMLYGWIKPDGTVWGCGYACHDRLLRVLGIEIQWAEEQGWARVSQYPTVQCRYRLTPKQRLTAKKLGKQIDLSTELGKKQNPNQ